MLVWPGHDVGWAILGQPGLFPPQLLRLAKQNYSVSLSCFIALSAYDWKFLWILIQHVVYFSVLSFVN